MRGTDEPVGVRPARNVTGRAVVWLGTSDPETAIQVANAVMAQVQRDHVRFGDRPAESRWFTPPSPDAA
jgi:hypothetical protein